MRERERERLVPRDGDDFANHELFVLGRTRSSWLYFCETW
jgi:hypothetical protein